VPNLGIRIAVMSPGKSITSDDFLAPSVAPRVGVFFFIDRFGLSSQPLHLFPHSLLRLLHLLCLLAFAFTLLPSSSTRPSFIVLVAKVRRHLC
jgi:hypothetical protein